MKTRHSITSTLLIVLMLPLLFLFSGCSSSQTPDQVETRVITDCIGRRVKIPEKVERVACIDSFSGEIMVMTGAGDQMVCCPNGVKTDSLLAQIYPGLKDVSVVQSSGTINAEALLQLQPDVILLKNSFYIVPQELDKIEKTALPYLVVQYKDMTEQINAIRMIGEVVGGPSLEKAEEIADYYEETIDLVKTKAENIPENERKTVYHSINGVTRTDGVNSLGSDWIEAVGCVDVSVGETLLTEGDVYTASTEQIFVWDPDAIICNDPHVASFFQTGNTFAGLRAVRENQVYNIPIGATRWGQQGSAETYFAMLWLGCTLYPDYYQDVYLKQEVFDFYESILGISLTNEQYKQIIEGEGIRGMSMNSGRK